MTWPVVFYRTSDGSEPVKDYLDGLTDRDFAILENQLERLETFGPMFPFPYSSQVEGDLRELRCHIGSRNVRFLYRRSENIFCAPSRLREVDQTHSRSRQGHCTHKV